MSSEQQPNDPTNYEPALEGKEAVSALTGDALPAADTADSQVPLPEGDSNIEYEPKDPGNLQAGRRIEHTEDGEATSEQAA